MFHVLPGLGTEQTPIAARFSLAFALSGVLLLAGLNSPLPSDLAAAAVGLIAEYLFGYLLGTLPLLVLDGVAIAGQLTAASIGLAQASTIDPSIGQSVTVLSHFKTLLATLIF
ncbi:flagellar biosynthetic protein FliR, partial [Arthrospira platensis SPKY1]|nr:flagellar biosynthetic protein FliR [Arthrospira platensis SPKY1]